MNTNLIIVVAAAEGGVVMAIVLTISVISWIVNLIQGNTPKGKPTKRPRPQAIEDLEQFLQATVATPEREREKKRPAPNRPNRPAGEKRPNKPKQSQSQRPNAQRPNAQRPASQQRPAQLDRPGTRLAQSHLAQTAMGLGGRSNIGPQAVDESVKKDVELAVKRDIDDAVSRDIGVDGTLSVTQAQAVHPLIQALRNPQGIRQAILLNEVLSRPKSLR